MGYAVKSEQAYAYAEMLEILDILGDDYVSRLPKKLIKIFDTFKDDTYEKHLNPEVPLDEQELSDKTRALVAVMLVNYWYESEEEKQELLATYKENERKYQEELKAKYNPDNIFNNKQNEAAAEVKSSSYIDNTAPEISTPAREVANETPEAEPARTIQVSSMAVEDIAVEDTAQVVNETVVDPAIDMDIPEAETLPDSANLPLDMDSLPWYKKIIVAIKEVFSSLFKKKDSSKS